MDKGEGKKTNDYYYLLLLLCLSSHKMNHHHHHQGCIIEDWILHGHAQGIEVH
jgi:hypothetical protein